MRPECVFGILTLLLVLNFCCDMMVYVDPWLKVIAAGLFFLKSDPCF